MSAFVKVAQVSDVPPGTARCVIVAGTKVAVVNLDGDLFAIDDTCTHAEASLSEGILDGDCLECPLHGALFNVRTGAAESLPAYVPVRTHNVRVDGDDIYVSLS